MRVLQFLTHLDIGGIPSYVYNISKYLVSKGIEVAVASSGGEWEKRFTDIGVKVFYLPIKTKSELSLNVLSSACGLGRIRREFPFDIIHAHTRVTQTASAFYSFFSRVPYVTTFHGFYASNKKRFFRRILKAQGKAAIAITPQVAQDLVECFNARPDRVRVIVSPIDFSRLNASAGPLSLKGHPRIGASGRLSPVKGFIYLIEAMPSIIDKHPEAILYIFGSGPQYDELMQRVIDLNIVNRVVFLRDLEIGDFLRALDIFCLPSIDEPLGLSVIEAQYFGLPSIVSDAGGLKILVKDKETGLVVERANYKQISSAVDLLMRDDILRGNISRACRENVLANFDLSKRIDEFIAVYSEAMR